MSLEEKAENFMESLLLSSVGQSIRYAACSPDIKPLVTAVVKDLHYQIVSSAGHSVKRLLKHFDPY